MRSTAAIFGAPVTDPPGKSAWRISASPAPGRSVALDGRDEMLDACERLGDHQLGPAHAAGHADPGEIVALEIDDHHVLGGVLRGGEKPRTVADRSRALDRPGAQRPSPTEEEQLGRCGDDRPAVPSKEAPATVAERRVVRLCQGGQPGGERAHAARERGGEVLDEVDLVDVAAGDRGSDTLDRRGVVPLRPRPAPPSDLQVVMLVVMLDIMPEASDGACGERERARLGWELASASCGSSPRARSRGRGRREVPRLPARRTLARGATPRSARRLHRPRAPRAGLGRRAVRRRRCRQRARTCQVSACESSRP